jgi:hypothetical protein
MNQSNAQNKRKSSNSFVLSVSINVIGLKVVNNIVWSISICASLPRWVLEFGFQVNIFLECGPFGKLNKSNRIRLCDYPITGFDFWITLSKVRNMSKSSLSSLQSIVAHELIEQYPNLPPWKIADCHNESMFRPLYRVFHDSLASRAVTRMRQN